MAEPRPATCCDCGAAVTRRSTYCRPCIGARQSTAAYARISAGTNGRSAPGLERCTAPGCARLLDEHARCADCTVLVGPAHLEITLTWHQGTQLCSGCLRWHTRARGIDWSAA